MIGSTVSPPMMDRRCPANTRPTRTSIRSCSDRNRRAALAIDTESSPTLNAATARTFRRMPWFVMQSSTISASCKARESSRALCLIGITKLPWPVTMRNWVSCRRCFEPEIRSASLGAGMRQNNMGISRSDRLGEPRDENRTRGHALDDHDAAVPRHRLVRPGRERLGPAPDRKQHLARPTGWYRDGHPPDRSEKILCSVSQGRPPPFSILRRIAPPTPLAYPPLL